MKKLFKATGYLFLVVLMCSCAATKQYVALPDQSKTIEDESKARVYVLRPTWFATAVNMRVEQDDELIGLTGPQGYLCWESEPKTSTIMGKSENKSELDVELKAGEVYYIHQSVRLGFFIARNKIKLLDAEEGKTALKKCSPPKVISK